MTDLTAPFFLRDGHTCSLYDPEPDVFSRLDVAATLATLNRWGGNTSYRYSVAEHSLLVAYLVPPHLRRAALVHDAGEAITGDICRPLRAAFPALDLICDSWQDAANAYFGIDGLTGLDAMTLHLADDVAAAIEVRDLLHHHPRHIQRAQLPDAAPIPLLTDLFGLSNIANEWAEIWECCLLSCDEPDAFHSYERFITNEIQFKHSPDPKPLLARLAHIRDSLDTYRPART